MLLDHGGGSSSQTQVSHFARISSIRKKVGIRRTIQGSPVPDPMMIYVEKVSEERTRIRPTAIISPEPDSSTSVALITLPFVPDKIFLGIDEKPDTWINLLHSPDRDITLNGGLAADGSGFARLGFVNRKKKISMDIAVDKFTLFAAPIVQTYNWTSALHGVRSVKKEGRKIILSLDPGFRVIVFLKKNPDRLKLHVENKNQDSDFLGLIGQMMTEENILVESDQMTLLGESYPAESFPVCNFSSYGVKQQGSCTKVTVHAMNAFAQISHRVPGIFDIPLDS